MGNFDTHTDVSEELVCLSLQARSIFPAKRRFLYITLHDVTQRNPAIRWQIFKARFKVL